MSNAGPYSRAIGEHFRRPRNYGPLPNASAEAEGANPLCGDRVRMAVAIDASGERIVEARFTANACAICVASASLLTERLRGMSITEAMDLTDGDALGMLEGAVPAARRRCATLPLEATQRALASSASGAGVLSGRSPIVAVLLAAGTASRFGSQKLLARLPDADGEPMPLARAAAIALQRAGLEQIVVVLGREAEAVRRCLEGLDLCFVTNEAYASGMSSSLRAGVNAAMSQWPAAAGVLIALGDQPLPDAAIVRSLIDTFGQSTASQVVAPRYRGVRGNPVVFARALVPELLDVAGDRGARDVIERDAQRVAYVDFGSASPPDVDTAEDLARLRLPMGDH
jgi:molybdenum cofactor cytidylyltransferase